MTYRSTKRYGHEVGLSCAFRQWRANSHCNLIHGYSLAFTFVFECEELDERLWCIDFGGLKGLKQSLHQMFDHTLAVAGDDPYLPEFQALKRLGLADIRIFSSGIGCEKFAQAAYELAADIIKLGGDRVKVISCECAEHGANSAIYYGE